MSTISQRVSDVDRLVRNGEMAKARIGLREIVDKKPPRALLVELASLAWRANAPNMGLRLLNALVRPDRRTPVVATAEEKVEYAGCLIKIGASEEAKTILDKIDGEKFPRAWLFSAFALISTWNYHDAIPFLERYSESPHLDEYPRMVGKVNLAEALVHEGKLLPATRLLNELSKYADKNSVRLMKGKLLELKAQNLILNREYGNPETMLVDADNLLSGSEGLDQFFVEKWRVILKFIRSSSLPEIERFRNKALAQKHWETVRDLDQFVATILQKRDLFLKLYFGTGFPAFRSRLLQDFGSPGDLPETFDWNPWGEGSGQVLDLTTGKLGTKGQIVKVGQNTHRVLVALSSDFYRPLRVGAFHLRLYPGEFFNPTTSPSRVHESVLRFRSWAKREKIPLTIEQAGGTYQLKAVGPVQIRVPKEWVNVRRETAVCQRLKEHFGNESFSLKAAGEVIAVSDRSMHNLLEVLCKMKMVARTGRARATRYRVC